MSQPHLFNLAIHILAGTLAIVLGLYLLAMRKGTPLHRRRGRWFAWLTLLVCATAAIGNLLFGYRPVFAVLTVLVLYQLLSGWRAVHTRENGPQMVDGVMTAIALVCGLLILSGGSLLWSGWKASQPEAVVPDDSTASLTHTEHRFEAQLLTFSARS